MTKWHFPDSANAAKLPDKNETFKTVKTKKKGNRRECGCGAKIRNCQADFWNFSFKAKWSCLPNIEKSEKKRPNVLACMISAWDVLRCVLWYLRLCWGVCCLRPWPLREPGAERSGSQQPQIPLKDKIYVNFCYLGKRIIKYKTDKYFFVSYSYIACFSRLLIYQTGQEIRKVMSWLPRLGI